MENRIFSLRDRLMVNNSTCIYNDAGYVIVFMTRMLMIAMQCILD